MKIGLIGLLVVVVFPVLAVAQDKRVEFDNAQENTVDALDKDLRKAVVLAWVAGIGQTQASQQEAIDRLKVQEEALKLRSLKLLGLIRDREDSLEKVEVELENRGLAIGVLPEVHRELQLQKTRLEIKIAGLIVRRDFYLKPPSKNAEMKRELLRDELALQHAVAKSKEAMLKRIDQLVEQKFESAETLRAQKIALRAVAIKVRSLKYEIEEIGDPKRSDAFQQASLEVAETSAMLSEVNRRLEKIRTSKGQVKIAKELSRQLPDLYTRRRKIDDVIGSWELERSFYHPGHAATGLKIPAPARIIMWQIAPKGKIPSMPKPSKK